MSSYQRKATWQERAQLRTLIEGFYDGGYSRDQIAMLLGTIPQYVSFAKSRTKSFYTCPSDEVLKMLSKGLILALAEVNR